MNTNSVKRPIYCWDSSAILGWFNEEEDKPLDDMALVIDEVCKDEAVLLLSVTVYCEVLCVGKGTNGAKKFRSFLDRSTVEMVNVTPPIASLTAKLREKEIEQGRKLRTPDAQILATAMLYQASVLH